MSQPQIVVSSNFDASEFGGYVERLLHSERFRKTPSLRQQVRRQGEMETAESAGSPPPPNPPLVVTQFSVETAVASNRRPVRRSAFAMGGSFAAGV
jgi:hypothetical protein